MMSKNLTYTTLLIFLIFSSCDFVDELKNMDYPEVNSCTYDTERICLDFSSEMDRTRTESSFSCKCNNVNENGIFLWKNDSMFFYPTGGVKERSDYEIELGTGAEDTYGNSLSESFIFRFSTKGTIERFFVKSINIPDGDIIDNLLKTIKIEFSDSVDESSFFEGFSIYPAITGEIIFNGNRDSIEFKPLKQMSADTKYTITLKDTIADRQGNNLGEKYEIAFRTAKDDEFWLESLSAGGRILSPSGILNSGLEKSSSLTLTFAGKLSEDAKKAPISTSPKTSYTCNWNNNYSQCTITFDKSIEYKTLLEITPIENIYGENAKSSFQSRYTLLFDGEKSRPPAVSTIRYYEDFSSGSSVEITYGTSIAFTSVDEACFEFEFKLGETLTFYKTDVYGKIDIDVINGDTLIEEKRLEIEDNGNGKTLVRVFCKITSCTVQSPVIITVDKNLQDSNSNKLGENFVVRFNSI